MPMAPPAVHRPRTWAAEHQRNDAGNVDQVTFVSWRAKLCASIVEAHQFDRTEAIRQMDLHDCDRKQDDRWKAYHGDEGPEEERCTTYNLCDDGCPCHQLRRWHFRSMQDWSKCRRT